MESSISRISFSSEITLITLSSLSSMVDISRTLSAFSANGINVDMISQTAPQGGKVRLSFTVSDRDLGQALITLGQLNSEKVQSAPEVLPGNCKIVFSDPNMVNTPGVAAKVFSILADEDIQVMLVTTSDVDISILLSEHAMHDALRIFTSVFNTQPFEVSF